MWSQWRVLTPSSCWLASYLLYSAPAICLYDWVNGDRTGEGHQIWFCLVLYLILYCLCIHDYKNILLQVHEYLTIIHWFFQTSFLIFVVIITFQLLYLLSGFRYQSHSVNFRELLRFIWSTMVIWFLNVSLSWPLLFWIIFRSHKHQFFLVMSIYPSIEKVCV